MRKERRGTLTSVVLTVRVHQDDDVRRYLNPELVQAASSRHFRYLAPLLALTMRASDAAHVFYKLLTKKGIEMDKSARVQESMVY